MSDRWTPETERKILSIDGEDDPVQAVNSMIAFARRLERQRDAAVEALKKFIRAGVGNSTHFQNQNEAAHDARAVLSEIEEGKS